MRYLVLAMDYGRILALDGKISSSISPKAGACPARPRHPAGAAFVEEMTARNL